MMEVMHLGEDVTKGFEVMMGDSTAPNRVPPEYREAFLRMARARMPELLRAIAPMYAARLTSQDVAEVTAFYRSAAAQHLRATTDAIDAEMSGVVERWAYKVFGEMMIELGNAPPN